MASLVTNRTTAHWAGKWRYTAVQPAFVDPRIWWLVPSPLSPRSQKFEHLKHKWVKLSVSASSSKLSLVSEHIPTSEYIVSSPSNCFLIALVSATSGFVLSSSSLVLFSSVFVAPSRTESRSIGPGRTTWNQPCYTERILKIKYFRGIAKRLSLKCLELGVPEIIKFLF